MRSGISHGLGEVVCGSDAIEEIGGWVGSWARCGMRIDDRWRLGEKVVDVRGPVVDVRARNVANGLMHGGAGIERLPARVRESAKPGSGGEYTARRLRSQREIVRDVMLAASECDTWLTLSELRALTRYGEASISAQLRHLRKMENGAYQISKRHRDGVVVRAGIDGRGECVWEYRIAAREYGRIAA